MKRFIIRLSIFLVLVFLLLTGLDIFVSKIYRNSPDRRVVVWNEITQGVLESDVVILGSSRAWVQYSPAILDSILNVSTYNLGIDGSPFNRQIERYQVYCKYNKKPSVIIQNIDFFSTLGYVTGYERVQYFPFLYNADFRRIIKEPFSWYEYLPMGRYYGQGDLFKDMLFNQYKNDIRPYNNGEGLYKGYSGMNWSWDGSALARLDSITFAPDERTKRLFLDFLAETKAEGQKVIFVYAPFYIEGLQKVTNIEESFAIFDSIANEFDVPILDYTYSPISYDTAYFYNASHLNKQGAELFSTMLANDLDSLGIIH